MSQRQIRGRRRKTDDIVPPTGRWVNRSPRPGTQVSGTINLDLLASDNRGMLSVTFYVNGEEAGLTSVVEASSVNNIYSLAVNTRAWANGTYNISAYLAADDGPGMTKNLGSVTFSNNALPSLAITSHAASAAVTLPTTITVAVTPAGETYSSPVLDINGLGQPNTTEISPNVWTFAVTTTQAATEFFTVAPYITLGGDKRLYGDSIVLENSDYYSAVSVSFAISSAQTVVGSTVTITPTVSGDRTDLSLNYDFNGDGTFEISNAGVAVTAVATHAYITPGTFTPLVRIKRSETILSDSTLDPITVSPNPASDTTAPVISVVTPTVGATVSGSLTVTFTATDAVGVTGVRPSYNGIAPQLIPVTSTVAATVVTVLNTNAFSEGALTIGGTAYDAAGNAGTATAIVVTVDNVPSADPDVRVLGNGVLISDGASVANTSDHTLFASTVNGGAGTERTFTVENTGTANLTISGLTVPTGFTVIESLSATIAAGASDTFSVRLDPSTVGVKSGSISFTTNVSGKNPYNFAIEGEVTASAPPDPPSDQWYHWSVARPFTSMTETRRNMSGSTQVNAPVKFHVQFHPGEIPTTKTLQLKDNGGSIIPTTDWQWGERSTFPDGSLRSAIVRCYGPASWTDNTDQTFTVEAITGSWPAETDSRPLSTVAAASNVRLLLEDITHIGYPQFSTTQPAYTGGATLDFDLNRAMVRAFVPTKKTAGAICTQFYTWEKLKVPGSSPGSGGDAGLWVKCWTEVWYAPGTNTVRRQSNFILLMNGWARVQGYAVAFKMSLLNGGTTLRNYSPSFTRTAANYLPSAGVPWYAETATFNGSDWATFDYVTNQVRPGNAIKVTGTTTSGLTTGKIYFVTKTGGGTVTTANGTASDGFREGNMKPLLGFAALGRYGSSNAYIAGGTGGGTMTFQVMNYITDKDVFPIRDAGGEEFWPVGGDPKIWPNWSRAEKIRRMQTGHIPAIPIESVVDVGPGAYQGRTGNGTNNTDLIPVGNSFQVYQPGGTNHHAQDMEAGGYYQDSHEEQGKHKGECSAFMFNLLNDMCSDTAPWHRIQRQCAAEAAAFSRGLNLYESTLGSNGIELAVPVCINNGPNKDGVPYSGLGPCFPTNNGIYSGGAPPGFTVQENDIGHYSTSRMSGSHVTKEYVFSYMLYAEPDYRELIANLWIICSNNDGGATSTNGYNKPYGGEIYYRFHILGTSTAGAKRNNIGLNMFLANSLWIPDSEPIRAMLDDIVADNINLFNLFYNDSGYFGQTAKIIGIQAGTGDGSQQSWHITRAGTAALYLAKASGFTCPNVVKHFGSFSRWMWGDPHSGGVASSFGRSGYLGHIGGMLYMDNAAWAPFNSTNDISNPAATVWRFGESASRSTDASTVAAFMTASTQTFKGDGFTFRQRQAGTEYTGTEFIANNGDVIYVRHGIKEDARYGIPAAILGNTPYWLYNKTASLRQIAHTGQSSLLVVGETLTQGSKTAVVTNWDYPGIEHTIPSAGDFTAGLTVTSGTGKTFTYPSSYLSTGYDYRLSSTDVAGTTTPATWAVGADADPRVLSGDYQSHVCVIYKGTRSGPYLGGLIHIAGMQRNAVAHNAGSGLVAATMFGPNAGCDTMVTNYLTFISNMQAGQGQNWLQFASGYGTWVHHYAYGPGAT